MQEWFYLVWEFPEELTDKAGLLLLKSWIGHLLCFTVIQALALSYFSIPMCPLPEFPQIIYFFVLL